MRLAGLKRVTLVTMCLSVAGPLAAQTPPSSTGTLAPQPVTIHTTEPRPQVDAPFARLFQNLGDDLRGLSSPEHALWLGAAGSVCFVGHILDEEDLTARAASSQSAETFFDAGKVLGGTLVQVGGALATYTVGRIADNRAVAHLGSDLIRAQVLTRVVTQGIKLSGPACPPRWRELLFSIRPLVRDIRHGDRASAPFRMESGCACLRARHLRCRLSFAGEPALRERRDVWRGDRASSPGGRSPLDAGVLASQWRRLLPMAVSAWHWSKSGAEPPSSPQRRALSG